MYAEESYDLQTRIEHNQYWALLIHIFDNVPLHYEGLSNVLYAVLLFAQRASWKTYLDFE
tara:strand:+ start:892 stop:1071 length:180 start_codon:yes stop_codon:yes gene_type:complete